MPDEELIQQVANAVRQLGESVPSGEVEGGAVADHLGIDPEDSDLFWAFKVAAERGRITVGNWPGSMGLPEMVKAP
jgi:hypothetical protein